MSVRTVTWLAASLALASFVAFDPAGWYPFGPAKWLATATVASAALAALLFERRFRVPRLTGPIWLGLLVLLVGAALVGLDRRLAWFGTAERHLGVVTWLLFAACFVVGANLVVRRDVATVVRGVVVATLFAGGYAVVELWFGRPVALAVDTARLGGSFGSAAYLGAAMTLAVPVCIGSAADRSTSTTWRRLAGLAGGLGLVALLGSGTRGAWIGLAAAALTAAPRVWRALHRRRVVLALVGVAAVSVAVIPRLDVVTQRAESATSRLEEWGVALKVVAARPLLGAGPEGYRLELGRGIDAHYEKAYGRDVVSDRAHNALLDVAATTGIPAAVAYLALITMVAVAALRLVRRSGPMLAGIGVATIAYSLQQLVLFPIAEIDVVFWLLGGIVIAAGDVSMLTVRSPQLRRLPVMATMAGLVAAAVFAVGVAGVAADRLAERAVTAHDPQVAAAAAAQSLRLRPDVLRVRVLMADLDASTGTLAGTDAAIDATNDALRWSPNDPIVRRQRATYLSQRADITGAAADVKVAVEAWNDLVAGDPNCYSCQLGLGTAAAAADDVATARGAWTKAATLTNDPLPGELLRWLEGTDAS